MKVTRAQVVASVQRWASRLELDRWGLTIQCPRRMEHTADCLAEPEYSEATLRFHLNSIRPEEVDRRVVHEMLHCHTAPLWFLALEWAGDNPARQKIVHDAHENLTSTLQRIVMR